MINRRRFIATGTSGLLLGGCDRLNNSAQFRGVLRSAEKLTMASQRLISPRDALAREFRESDISPIFRSNGTRVPGTDEYAQHAAEQFANWRLQVDGLVTHPLSIPLRTLRTLPHKTQITRHDCVEGWSAIGKWTGAQLGPLLQSVGLKPDARYLVFHCADTLGPDGRYYESIDLIDAFHPQTILAYDMNGAALAEPHGAPLRLRVERQLGYKHAKYVMRIEAVSSFASMRGGRGGFWEDLGYEWYAGI
jgi:DMSO/TMAO reductase YedYZ molybdopterin-dependent catalytic subunit